MQFYFFNRFFALPGSLTQPTTDHLSRTPVDVLPNLGPSVGFLIRKLFTYLVQTFAL